MQRIPHNKDGVWIQQFKYVNKTQQAKRYYLDSASVLLYTINISLNDEEQSFKIEYPATVVDKTLTVSFGQFLTPFRNLNMFKRFYFDFDVSFNRKGRLSSYPEDEDPTSQLQLIVEGESFSKFATRNGLTLSGPDFELSLPKDIYKLYLGYNHIRNFGTDVSPISKYEAIASEVLADIPDDCFTWVEIKNNVLDLSEVDMKTFNKSSALLLDYKLVVDLEKFEEWLLSTYTYRDMLTILETMSTSGLDFNFIFYPPVASGLQLEDVPVILSPNGILKNKLVSQVIFNISKSFVDNSQKMFEIYFLDNESNEIIFKADSLKNSEDFTLVGKNINIVPEYLEMENSIFEDISGIDYPTRPFKVTYNMPNDLKKYLSNHLNYTILVRVTDLTSERLYNVS
jgi:hypothetical protein